MLKKQNRLTRVGNFKTDKLFTSRLFNLRTSKNQEGRTRFAFIVSKKIDARATVRNRTKRILRSMVEEALANLKSGFDFIFTLKRPLSTEEKQEALNSLEDVFKKAQVLKNE